MKKFLVLLVTIALMAFAMGVKNEICNQPTSADGDGLRACLAYIPSYSYNPGTNECVQFIYGGCGGNDNRFPTLKDCEDKCKE